MIRYFCVSDIHSYYQPLLHALVEKGFNIDNKDHKLIICGDAFDRGDDTVSVFNFMKKLNSENRLIYIRGNHEYLLLDCLNDILHGKTPGSHHFHNGTVKTICALCEQQEWIVYAPQPPDVKRLIKSKTKELVEFIGKNCVDYFKLGNKIFVHSWVPLIRDETYYGEKYLGIDEIWDKDIESLKRKEKSHYQDVWEEAVWGNPFLKWKSKYYPEGKCIVFGHFHTSYGHSRIDYKCKEFPPRNSPNWQDAFKPWIKENAIGMDACVAYSGMINCLVFDEKGDVIS